MRGVWGWWGRKGGFCGVWRGEIVVTGEMRGAGNGGVVGRHWSRPGGLDRCRARSGRQARLWGVIPEPGNKAQPNQHCRRKVYSLRSAARPVWVAAAPHAFRLACQVLSMSLWRFSPGGSFSDALMPPLASSRLNSYGIGCGVSIRSRETTSPRSGKSCLFPCLRNSAVFSTSRPSEQGRLTSCLKLAA